MAKSHWYKLRDEVGMFEIRSDITPLTPLVKESHSFLVKLAIIGV